MHQLFTYHPSFPNLPVLCYQILERNIALRQKVLPFLDAPMPSKKAELLSKGLSDTAKGKDTMPSRFAYSTALLIQAMTIGKLLRAQTQSPSPQLIDTGVALLNMGIDEERIALHDLPHFISYLMFALVYAHGATHQTLVERTIRLFGPSQNSSYSREHQREIFMFLIGCLSESEKMDGATLTNKHIETAVELLDKAAKKRIVDPLDQCGFFSLLHYLLKERSYVSQMNDYKCMLILTCVENLLDQISILANGFRKDPSLWIEFQRRIPRALEVTNRENIHDSLKTKRSELESKWSINQTQMNRIIGIRAP